MGAVVPILVSLVTVPLYLAAIGLERYGILTLCWVLVGYFNFFDFGLGRATAQRIALLTDGDPVARERAFWAGVSLSIGLAIAAALVIWPVTSLAFMWIKVGSSGIRSETQAAIPFLIAAVPLAVSQSSLRGALEGRRRFLTINLIGSIAAIATGVLPLLAAYLYGPQLPVLVGVTLAVRIATLVAYWTTSVRAVPIHGFVRPHKEDMRSMARFGAWLTVTNIVGPIMVLFDRFLIGSLVNAAAVALYAIPYNLINQILIVPNSLSTALFPKLAASQEHTSQWAREALFKLTFFLTPMTLAAILLMGPFLRLWIGSTAAAHAAPIAYVLVVGFWANGLAQLPYSSLQAAGRTDLTAKVHVAELIPYLAALWLGLSTIGVLGAAVAWSARAFVDMVALGFIDKLGIKPFRILAIQGVAVTALAATMLFLDGGSANQVGTAILICLATAAYLKAIIPPPMVQLIVETLRRYRLLKAKSQR